MKAQSKEQKNRQIPYEGMKILRNMEVIEVLENQ
jgi:hypothetical protein